MKNLKFLMLAIAGCFALGSCDDDDDNNNNQNDALVGTYTMTSWNGPVARDFNNDGTSSTNFMIESDCFDNSTIVINQNGTYTMTYNEMALDGTAWGCANTQTTTGTWTRNGNTFTTTSVSGGMETDTDFTFSQNNGTLTRSMTNVQYPSFNATTGDAEFAMGNVNYVFTR